MSPDQAVRRWLVFGILRVAGAARRLATSSETTYKLLFLPGFEAVRWRFGKWHAWLAAERARKQVPAYRTLLDEHGDPRVRARGLDPDLGVLPVTDKAELRRAVLDRGALPRRRDPTGGRRRRRVVRDERHAVELGARPRTS